MRRPESPARAAWEALSRKLRLQKPPALELPPPIAGFAAAAHSRDELGFAFEQPTRSSFAALLKWLPPSCDLSFFDRFYPSISDPGAYVAIQRDKEIFAYSFGNHGWRRGWQVQSVELLIAWIMLNVEWEGPHGVMDKVIVRRARRFSIRD